MELIAQVGACILEFFKYVFFLAAILVVALDSLFVSL